MDSHPSSCTYNTTPPQYFSFSNYLASIPKNVIHTKNITLEGALTRQILFQGERNPLGLVNA